MKALHNPRIRTTRVVERTDTARCAAPPLTAKHVTATRCRSLYMKLFLSKLEVKPPVPPGEPRGLNKERPRQCTEACESMRDGDREGPVLLAATSRVMAR